MATNRQGWLEEARMASLDLLVEVELTARWMEQVPDGEPVPEEVGEHRRRVAGHHFDRLTAAFAELLSDQPSEPPPGRPR